MYMLQSKNRLYLMPGLHFPRAPYDKLVYDFSCDFGGVVGGHGLRCLCLHYLRASCHFLYCPPVAGRGESVQRLLGDCTKIVQFQCGGRAVSAASARKSYEARRASVQRLRGEGAVCSTTYDMSTGYGLTIFQICITSRETKS